MLALFHTILFQPVYNLLILLYDFIPGNDMGLAIIALTILLKIILFPFNWKALQSQKALNELQPKLLALQEKYKDDKAKLATETMNLYKEQKVNPLSSCLPILIQLPILIAVYQAFRVGLTALDPAQLYSFVPHPESINTISFGILDLSKSNVILAFLAGGAQFLQTKLLPMVKPAKKAEASKDENMLASMNKSMLYVMPIMTIFIGVSLPSGLTLYWFLTTILTAVQQYFMFKSKKKTEVTVIETK